MLVLTLLNFPTMWGPMSKHAPKIQAPASTGTATDITKHFLAGPAWSAGLGRREPARLSLQMQETHFQPAASQVQSNAQGSRSGQHASVQDAKEVMHMETACQVFVAFTAYAGMQKKFMQVETAGFQVFCCVRSMCRDVKESTKDAMGQCVCHVHSMCRDIAFHSMQGELSSSRVDRYLLLTAVSPGGTVMWLGGLRGVSELISVGSWPG